MAPKRASYITYGTDEKCAETRRFLENSGVDIEFRDLLVKPLTEDEAYRMIGNWDIHHFLNPASESYQRHGFDQHVPSRLELAKLVSTDPTLLRRPIIRNARLMTIGCDKRKIAEMFQISMNGKGPDEDSNGTNNQPPKQQSSPISS